MVDLAQAQEVDWQEDWVVALDMVDQAAVGLEVVVMEVKQVVVLQVVDMEVLAVED